MKDEFMYEDLIGMVNFTDETASQQMPVMEVKSKRNTNAEVNTEVNTANAEVKTEKRVKRIAEDCSDCPFTKNRSLFDRLWDMTKWLGICGGISMLMWWFEMNGLMATEAARPFTFACGCIGCFGGGMSFKK
jgi:hypothetical protein